jgi:hypothetical protein
VRLLDTNVTRVARDGDCRQEGATTCDRNVEQSGLRDDRSVGLHTVVDHGDPAGTRWLLVGNGADDKIAREPQAERGQDFGGEHHRGYAALHGGGAASLENHPHALGLGRGLPTSP